jgi:anthranilate/para-aminobenzoate synthase component I
MGVGAGIVTDSDPTSEFEETMTEVRALMEAIASAREEN